MAEHAELRDVAFEQERHCPVDDDAQLRRVWRSGVRVNEPTAVGPDDVADACLFLASPQATGISGASLLPQGGGQGPR